MTRKRGSHYQPAGLMGMAGIYRGLIEDATLIVERIGGDLWIVQRDTRGPFAEVSRIPTTLVYRVHPFLLDVRTAQEFASGGIPGAVNIPVDDLRSRLGELPRDRKIAAYCQVGQRGYLATRILLQSGFSAVNVSGGYKTYQLFHPNAT